LKKLTTGYPKNQRTGRLVRLNTYGKTKRQIIVAANTRKFLLKKLKAM
jgi:hypothetical protein